MTMLLRALTLLVSALTISLHAQTPTSRPSAPRRDVETLAADAEDLFPAEPESFVLKPGERTAFRYVPETSGEASLWARSKDLDVTLEILTRAGRRVAFDDDSGGGTAAHAIVPVATDEELIVVVSAKGASKPARVRIALHETEITEKSIARRAVIDAAVASMKSSSERAAYAEARRKGRETLELIREAEPGSDSSVMQRLLTDLGLAAIAARDSSMVTELWKRILVACERTLPPDHLDLQRVRMSYGACLHNAGDAASARKLFAEVLEVLEGTVPEEHPMLLGARMNLANSLDAADELPRARALHEQVLAVRERTLSPDDPILQSSRMNYSTVLLELGDVAAARDVLEKVIDVGRRTLPEDAPSLLTALANYARILSMLGAERKSLELERHVLEVRERTLPEGHRDLLDSRISLGISLFGLGDFEGAGRIFERVVRAEARTLRPGHPALLRSKTLLANAFAEQGESERAKKLYESILQVQDEALPRSDTDLLNTRMNYAILLSRLGDLAKARSLQERIIAIREESLPPDHPDTLTDLMRYALTLKELGDREEALEIEKRVLDARAASLPPTHPALLGIRMNHAASLRSMGRFRRADEIEKDVVARLESSSLVSDVQLQIARQSHAITRWCLRDFEGALGELEKVLASWERALPMGHVKPRIVRLNIATVYGSMVRTGRTDLRAELTRRLEHMLKIVAEEAGRASNLGSGRQTAALAARLRPSLDRALTFVHDTASPGDVAKAAFLLAERLRAVAPRARRLLRVTGMYDRRDVARWRSELTIRSQAIEAFLAAPAVAEDAGPTDTVSSRLVSLVQKKEAAEASLTEALQQNPGATGLIRNVSLEEMADALPTGAVGVSYLGFDRMIFGDGPNGELFSDHVPSVAALVLDPDGKVRFVDLGTTADMIRLVSEHRAAVAAGGDGAAVAATGRALRAAVLDPVTAILGDDARHVVVALAGVLGPIGLDALPLDEGGHVGDRWTIDVVQGFEWLVRESPRELNPSHFVGLGAPDFGAPPKEPGDDARAPVFRELPYAKKELASLAHLWKASKAQILTDTAADERAFAAAAPKARFLHIASHGWFAPESVPSVEDATSKRGRSSIVASTFEDDVRGYEPLSLCGIALSGANLPAREDGTRPGVLTGNDIAALDLSGVELAVLSACDTSVGVLRAGQGIMSLQEALSSAGARYTITSLWKVADEATMELMTRFYDGIWRRGETKRQALWSAKKKLREMKDPRTGKPRFGVGDWAGWVLVGNPET